MNVKRLFRQYGLSILFAVLAVVYLVQATQISADSTAVTRYHISVTKAVILTLAVSLPYVLIWFVGLVGYLKFKAYTSAIRTTKDGAAFDLISKGILGLVLWLPLNAVLGQLNASVADAHPEWAVGSQRLESLVNTAILLVAFILLYRGSIRLLGVVRKTKYQMMPWYWALAFLVMAGVYVYLILHNDMQDAHIPGGYWSDGTLLNFVVLPRLVSWFLGLSAIWNIYIFSKNVVGSIYRRALLDVSVALAAITLLNIVLRYIATLSSLAKTGLGLILLIVYTLLIGMSLGYILLIRGTNKLNRIEEV